MARRKALLVAAVLAAICAVGLASTTPSTHTTTATAAKSPPPAAAHGTPAAGGHSTSSSDHSSETSTAHGGGHGGGHGTSSHHTSSDGEMYPPVFNEENAARALQWTCFCISLILALFYFWQFYIGTSKWEVLYVCTFESAAYVFDIWFLHKTPVSLVFKQGHHAEWIRYAEWLLTCPILLIALSRVGVADGSYSKRTMRLLTSDQGTILMGLTAAFAQGYVRLGFYLVGCAFGFNTYYTAAAVYLEAWRNVPDAEKDVVKWMAGIYYGSWIMFPVLFAIGKEGLGYLTISESIIGHCIADLLSKNLWGLCEWYLEYCVHGHGHKAAAHHKVPYDMDHRAKVAVCTGGPWTMEWFVERLDGTPCSVTKCPNLQVLQLSLEKHSFDIVIIDKAYCNGDTLKVVKETYRVPGVVVFATGGAAAIGAVKEQFEGLADEVIAGPVQGERFPGDLKHMFQEWHGKYMQLHHKGGNKQAHSNQDLAAMAPALAPSSPSRAGGSTNGMSPHAGYPQLPPGGYPSPGGGAAHHNPMMMGAGAPPAYTLGYGGGYPPAVPTALASGSGYVPAQ